MKQFMDNIFKNSILSGTAIVTLGVLISSVFSYLLQLTIARILSVSDYGTFNALLSYYVIFSVPVTVFSISLVKISSELKVEERFDKLTKLFWALTLISLIMGLIIFAIFSYFNRVLSDFSNINNPRLFSVLGIFISASFLLIAPAAYLQGLLRFKAFAFFTVLGSLLRFTLPVFFVVLGFGIKGIFLGMVLGILITFFSSIPLLKKNFTRYTSDSLSPEFKKLLKLSASVLFINLGLLLLNNIDVILVKKFFESEAVGYYSSIVTIGKVLLFGSSAVAIVMFPQITQVYNSKQYVIPAFKKFLKIQLVVVSVGVLAFSLFSGIIVKVLFGPAFLPAVSYIPKFSIFMGFYVLINFMVLFLLAVNKNKAYVSLIPAAIIQFLLISLYHNNISQVININILVSFVLLVGISIYFYINKNSIDLGK